MTTHNQRTVIAGRSKEWPRFIERLADALSTLEEDQFLIVAGKRSNRYVQFSGQGSFGLRAETTSNHFLARGEKLDRNQIAALKGLGWQAPTGNPKNATPEHDPDGSPNYFLDIPAPVDYRKLAALSVTTFIEVLGLTHPGRLEYTAFDQDGEMLDFPNLGLKRALPNQEARDDNAALLELIRDITQISTLKRDEDGDIGVRYGSTQIFARLLEEPRRVLLFAALVREVAECPEVHERINHLNAGSDGVRYFWMNETVYAALDVPADPFSASGIADAYRHFSVLIDDLDDLLQSELGGRTAFREWMPSVARH